MNLDLKVIKLKCVLPYITFSTPPKEAQEIIVTTDQGSTKFDTMDLLKTMTVSQLSDLASMAVEVANKKSNERLEIPKVPESGVEL